MGPRLRFYAYRAGSVMVFLVFVALAVWIATAELTVLIAVQTGALSVVLFAVGAGLWRIGARGRIEPRVVLDNVHAASVLGAEPYVLYLRSFVADPRQAQAVSPTQFRTQEERLAAIMSWIGRPVAVGAPGSTLSFAGFERIYLDEDWQSTVAGSHVRR